jgi:DNA polymerase-3 subunit alpha
MQKYLRELKPDQFADLIAMNALYRPGPLAYIPNYIARKHGHEPIVYDLPEMEEYLSETYGITVYQEQVMLLSQKLAGFSKGDADVLRKAMGKKDRKTLDKMKGKFMDGAIAKGLPKDKLEKIWTDWEAFAQYAFNKSHSTCYAFVAYQTAYLKAHYPSEYMAAVLNHAGSIEKITFFIEECKRMGIKVLGPDINESKKGFAVNQKGEIRFGLGGLKGVGEAAVESIIAEREKNGRYKHIFDFIRRINQRTVNKKSLESLIYSGAFDCFEDLHRAQYFYTPKGDSMNGLEKIIRYGNTLQQRKASTVNTLFGNLAESVDIELPKLPPCEPWTLTEKLGFEKEVTGMFISGHPLDHYRFEIKYYGITSLAEYAEFLQSDQVGARTFRLAGLVTGSRLGTTKFGKNYAVLNVEDYSGKAEFMLWSNDAAKFSNFLQTGMALFINGSVVPRMKYQQQEQVQDGWEFRINNIKLLETIRQENTRQVDIVLDPVALDRSSIDFFEKQLFKTAGNTQVKFILRDHARQFDVELTSSRSCQLNEEIAQYLLSNPALELRVHTAGLD